MSNEEAIANIIRLMTSFHLDIKALLDDLNIAKCKSVLKSECEMPCGCRFCRACIDEIKSIKHENNSIKEETKAIQDEMKSMKIENESIKRETEVQYDLAGKILEIVTPLVDERYQSDERDSTMVTAVTAGSQLASNQNEMEPVRGDIRSIWDQFDWMKCQMESMQKAVGMGQFDDWQIEEDVAKTKQDNAIVNADTEVVASNRDEMEPVRGDIRSIWDQFDRMKYQMESMQKAVGMGQFDDWLIEEDVVKTNWASVSKTSSKFGLTRTFELESSNSVDEGELRIWLRICAGPGDRLLQWPFRCEVTVTVANKDKSEACLSQTVQCEIEWPADNQYSASDRFVFPHDELRSAGVQPERGVRVVL